LFLLLNFHEFFIIFGHPDTFLLFPLVAPILCYVVMPRHFPYSCFHFVIVLLRQWLIYSLMILLQLVYITFIILITFQNQINN